MNVELWTLLGLMVGYSAGRLTQWVKDARRAMGASSGRRRGSR